MSRIFPYLSVSLLLSGFCLGFGCSSDSSSQNGSPNLDGSIKDASAPDVPRFIDSTSKADAAVSSEVASLGEIAPNITSDICARLGLPRTAFRDDSSNTDLDKVAGDFTVTEVNGLQWNLKNRWSGCESYVFITNSGTSAELALFKSSILPLVLGPENVHYFFLSADTSEEDRIKEMGDLRNTFEANLLDVFKNDRSIRDALKKRFHFVVNKADEVPGSIGRYMKSYVAFQEDSASVAYVGNNAQGKPQYSRPDSPTLLGIDLAQHFDGGDFLGPNIRSTPAFASVARLPIYYNYRAKLDAAMETEASVTKIDLLAEKGTARSFVKTVSLPDGSLMSGFDTMQFDVQVTCSERNQYACSNWDRIATIERCEDSTCAKSAEVARWITSYARRGRQRWSIEATPFLPLVRAGGTQTFKIVTGPDWEVKTPYAIDVRIRLSNHQKAQNPTGSVTAFIGGVFDKTYNSSKAPITFTPPADATRVELVYILSGHGQDAKANLCSEFCDHRHQFSVNGTDIPVIKPSPTSYTLTATGCADLAGRGVIPGQGGNWGLLRAYWCPGLPVEAKRIDITASVKLGQVNTLAYSAFVITKDAAQKEQKIDPPGGENDEIKLSSYVVWYR